MDTEQALLDARANMQIWAGLAALISDRAGRIDSVETPEDADVVGELLRRVAAAKSGAETARLSLTRPIDATSKQIIATFKPVQSTLVDADQHLRGLLDGFQRKQKAEQEEARRLAELKLETAIASGDREAADAALEAQLNPIAERPYTPPGTGRGGRWRAEVEDWPMFVQWCLDTNQTAFLSPTTGVLNNLASANKDKGSVPGLTFKKDEWVTAGRG